MKKVLSTKTLDPAMLQYAQTKQLELTCIDFIETSALAFNETTVDTNTYDAVVFTSANAVEYFFSNATASSLINNKAIYGLQGKTNEALLSHHLNAVATAASAAELAQVIIAGHKVKSVLHVCGNLKLTALEEALSFSGISYQHLLVYQTVKQTAQKVTDDFDAILFFSPSGVESFLVENELKNELLCCCIGKTTAAALKQKTNHIILPGEPTPLAMLNAVAAYLEA